MFPLKKTVYTGIATLTFLQTRLLSASSYLGISDSKLRNGDINFGDIPRAINSVTTFILGFSGTISMLMIIYGAVRMSLSSGVIGSADKEKGKHTIEYGIVGFVISVSAWFIINTIVANL